MKRVSILAWGLVVGAIGCAPQPETVGELVLAVEAPPSDPAQAAVVLEGAGVTAVRKHLGKEPSREEVDRVFYLAVRPAGSASAEATPPVPVMARLEWSEARVRLVPQASLTPGLRYEAVFDGPRLSPALPRLAESYIVPEETRRSEGKITVLHPNRRELPANQLKFYVHFSRPMAEGHAFRHARLLDARGEPIDQAFREVELWEDNHQRLTLWINPGRTKRALGLSESLGPVLEAGREYTLEIRPGFPDSRGRKLSEGLRHSFRTTAHDRTQPQTSSWRIAAPSHGTRDPLEVTFGEPMDHALAERGIRVLGPGDVEVPGTPYVSEDGLRWTFEPAGDWAEGEHVLVAAGEIEDLAGNSLYRPFETVAGKGPRPTPTPPEFRLPFTISGTKGSSPRSHRDPE